MATAQLACVVASCIIIVNYSTRSSTQRYTREAGLANNKKPREQAGGAGLLALSHRSIGYRNGSVLGVAAQGGRGVVFVSTFKAEGDRVFLFVG